MQNPPVTSGHRRAMSDHCDVIINDTEYGVVLVCDNRDKMMYTMRFDFGTSDNLKMEKVGEGVEKVSDMKCNIEVQAGTVRNLCSLVARDTKGKTGFELKYVVQCLVRNPKTGELEQVKAPPPPKKPGEDRTPITDTLTMIIQKAPDGYLVFFESDDDDPYNIAVDFAGSDNLTMLLGPNTQQDGPLKASMVLPPKTRAPFVKMQVKDRSKPAALEHSVTQSQPKKEPEPEPEPEPEEEQPQDDGWGAPEPQEEAPEQEPQEEAPEEPQEDDGWGAPDEPAAPAADDKKLKEALAALQAEERRWRIKIEAEWKVRWEFILRQWRESVCNLCRKMLIDKTENPSGVIVDYKIYRLHKTCYDNAAKCDFCGDILVGEYVIGKSGVKLHRECIEGYKKKSRPNCAKCGKLITEDKWATSADGNAFHTACRE